MDIPSNLFHNWLDKNARKGDVRDGPGGLKKYYTILKRTRRTSTGDEEKDPSVVPPSG